MTTPENLSPGQCAAVMHDAGPAAVYAGPGSGKTRVVTIRAARMAGAGHHILVTTFTSDAATEMRTRIGRIVAAEAVDRVHVSTVHALCLQLLRSASVRFQLLTDEHQRRSLAEAARAAELEGGVGGFLAAQSYQKNTGITAARYRHDGSTADVEFARVWRAYEKAKAQTGLREFDDLILDVVDLFKRDDAARSRVAAHYTHIIVDECQDMNSPQFGVVFALAQEHKNLMLVGDLDQSLYGFRGADTATFEQFAANRRTKVFELRENYRSSPAILSFADSLIRQNPERRAIDFLPVRDDGADVTWQRFLDPDIEALAVAESILRLRGQGVRCRDMAVLYRTNAQSEAFERHFAALEIPFAIRDDADFYNRREVRGMLSYLAFFAGHSSPPGCEAYPDEWLLALLNVPNRKLPRTLGAQLRNHAEIRGRRIWDILPEFHAPDLRSYRGVRQMLQELRQIDEGLPRATDAGEAVRLARRVTDFDGWLRRESGDDKDNDRIQSLQRMQAAAAHYPTIAEYLAAVRKVRDEAARRKSERARKRRERDEVTLSTGHAAKGLEWRCVFAVGWSEEILPHRKAEDIAEELRIAYVIATRARDLLQVSTLDTWNDAAVAPSRFLSGSRPLPSPLEGAAELAAAPEPDPDLGGLFQ